MKEKNEIILPVYYFPNLLWWHAYLRAEVVYFNVNEKYIKQSFRNRTCIKNPQGRLDLSIPVAYYPQNALLKDIQTANFDWKEHHYKSIYHNYRKSAFFEFYQDEVKAFFEQCNSNFIWEIALNSIEWLLQKIKISHRHTLIEKLPDYEIPVLEQMPNQQKNVQVLPYYQLFGDFIHNLSGLDALFCAGKGYFETDLVIKHNIW
jgi:hypothetical protein